MSNRSTILNNTLKRNPTILSSRRFQSEARKLILAVVSTINVKFEDTVLVQLCQEICLKKNRYFILDADLPAEFVNEHSEFLTVDNMTTRLQYFYDEGSKRDKSFSLLKIKIFSIRDYHSHYRIQVFADIE